MTEIIHQVIMISFYYLRTGGRLVTEVSCIWLSTSFQLFGGFDEYPLSLHLQSSREETVDKNLLAFETMIVR